MNDSRNAFDSDRFSVNGRGYPDVSLMGYNYQAVNRGEFAFESGTSASTPVFAGTNYLQTLIIDNI